MAVSESYRDFVLEQLGRVRPVTPRRMFGGVGLYADGAFFGLIDNDTLYFKTGDLNRGDYEARGQPPFRPFGPEARPMSYHEVPGDVLEDLRQLEAWFARAVAVAEEAGRRRTRRERPGR